MTREQKRERMCKENLGCLLTEKCTNEERIRADQRRKTIEEMAQTIREIEADTTHCMSDCPRADEPISCTICVLERAVEQLKEQK